MISSRSKKIYVRVSEFYKRDIKNFYYSKIKHMSEQQIKQEYLRKIGMNIGEECFIFQIK